MSPSLAAKVSKNKTAEQGYGGVDTYDLGSKSTSDHADILDLQRSAGNRAVNQALKSGAANTRPTQGKKLTISPPGDRYEQEADRIADQVMRMPDSEVGKSSPSITPVQKQSVQPYASSGQIVHDLNQVHVHTGPRAATLARMLGASAFTMGTNIVFGANEFQPTTPQGKRLLVHELAHVTQQARGMGVPFIQRDPLDEALAEGRTFEVVRITGLVVQGNWAEVPLSELSRLSKKELERILENMKDALKIAQTDKDRKNVLEFLSQKFSPAVKLKLRRQKRQAESRKLEEQRRIEEEARLSGSRFEGPPPIAPGRHGLGPGAGGLLKVGEAIERTPVVGLAVEEATRALEEAGRPTAIDFAARSAIAHYRGIFDGVIHSESTFTEEELRELRNKLLVSSPLFPAFCAGASVEIASDTWNTISGLVESIFALDEVINNVTELLQILTSPEGSKVAYAMGVEIGKTFRQEIKSLVDDNQLKFTYKLGTIVGPPILFAVLSIVTGGTVGAGVLAKRLAEILKKLPGAKRILSRMERKWEAKSSVSPTPTTGTTETVTVAPGVRWRRGGPKKGPVEKEQAQSKRPNQKGSTSEEKLGSDLNGDKSNKKTAPDPIDVPKKKFTKEEIEARYGKQVSPEQAVGFSPSQLQAAKQLFTGKGLTDSASTSHLADIWESVAKPGQASSLTISNSRRLFDSQKGRFWRKVRKDPDAVRMFQDMGATFPKGDATAPVMQFPNGETVRITIDHIIERQTNPGRALDASNLRFSTTRENTVLLRQITEQDPFQDVP